MERGHRFLGLKPKALHLGPFGARDAGAAVWLDWHMRLQIDRLAGAHVGQTRDESSPRVASHDGAIPCGATKMPRSGRRKMGRGMHHEEHEEHEGGPDGGFLSSEF